MATLNDSLVLMQKQISEVTARHDQNERRSREWCIRVHGIEEEDGENTRKVLSEEIAKYKLAKLDTSDKASDQIEHCHRMGNHKPRIIIASFYSRPMRNKLLNDAKPINHDKTKSVFFSEDMIKKDHEARLRARPQMKAAYALGHKVSFKRGQLFIDSRPVPISPTGSAQTVVTGSSSGTRGPAPDASGACLYTASPGTS